MFRRIVRFPFALTLLASFALSAYTGLSSHAQTLIVGEYFNHRAFEYDLNGNRLSVNPFASDPIASRFGGIAFDKNGYFYAATVQTHSVSIFPPNSQTKIGSIIVPGATETGAVAFDAAGNLYVTGYGDGNVYRISLSGETSFFASVAGAWGLVFDRSGNLYVSSIDTHSIYKVSPARVKTLFASGVPYPVQLEVDAADNLYVACYGTNGEISDEIRRFAPNGMRLLSWTSPYLSHPEGVKFGPDGNLYVANYAAKTADGMVYRFSSTGLGELGVFLPNMDYPEGLAFKPVPAPAVTVAGTVTFEGIVSTAPSRPVTFEFRVFGFRAFPPQTVTVPPSGEFSLSNIPRGNYRVHVKGDKYLAKNVSVDASNGDVSGIEATLKAGDANNDNFADIADLLSLIAHYNNGSGYLETCDFNGDASDDIFDLLLLIANYNQYGDS